MERITLRVSEGHLDGVDTLVEEKIFPNRSEAIRAAILDLLEKHGVRPRALTDGGVVQKGTATERRAVPADVDKERTLALGDCPECGDNSLATATVENAVYIASCAHCDHEIRAPVVVTDGETVVKFDAEPEDYPLPSVASEADS